MSSNIYFLQPSQSPFPQDLWSLRTMGRNWGFRHQPPWAEHKEHFGVTAERLKENLDVKKLKRSYEHEEEGVKYTGSPWDREGTNMREI